MINKASHKNLTLGSEASIGSSTNLSSQEKSGMGSVGQDLVHLIALPWVIPGHINPLLHVCSKLVALGYFKITFVNSFENHQRMFKTRDPVSRDGIDFVGISDGQPEKAASDHPPAGMEGIKEVLKSTDGLQAAAEELVESMIRQGIPLKAIISDTFVHWIQDISERFSLVRVAFSTTSATFDLVALYMKRYRDEGFLPMNTRTTGEKLIEFIPGMPSFSPFDLPLAFYDEHPIIDFITIPYQRLSQAQWILSGTFEELEADKVAILRDLLGTKNYLPVGPFLPEEHISGTNSQEQRQGMSHDDIQCLEWLDSRPKSSVLYVAFGSIAIMSRDQFQQLVLGLEDCGEDVGVLWAMRPNLVEGEFPREFFDGFLERNGHRVHVVSWAPQMPVLRHPAVGGFVTHCGWNSTLEGICAGVAMIGWPCLSEQNLNCSFLAEKKLVLRLKDHRKAEVDGGIVSKEEISRAIHELMHGEIGEEIRANVGELMLQARKAVRSGGSSHVNFLTFVNAMKQLL